MTAPNTVLKVWWLLTLTICALLIVGSQGYAWWKTTNATDTITHDGQTWDIVPGPEWTTCTYNGQQRPCRPVKD